MYRPAHARRGIIGAIVACPAELVSSKWTGSSS